MWLLYGLIFGFIALLEDKSFAENAEAIEDSEIILIPKEDFYSLIYIKRAPNI